MKTITLKLNDREARLLELLTNLNVSVPRAVVRYSALHAEERKAKTVACVKQSKLDRATAAQQEDELSDLLYKINSAMRRAGAAR